MNVYFTIAYKFIILLITTPSKKLKIFFYGSFISTCYKYFSTGFITRQNINDHFLLAKMMEDPLILPLTPPKLVYIN